jgi:hypothetical protein
MRTSKDEAIRKAAYEGLSVGPFVLENGFVEIINRNKMAKSLGFIDYYDYKVTNAKASARRNCLKFWMETGTRSIMVAHERSWPASRRGRLEPLNGFDGWKYCCQAGSLFSICHSRRAVRSLLSCVGFTPPRRYNELGLARSPEEK